MFSNIKSLGIDTEKAYCTLFDAIVGNVEIGKCIKNIYEGFDCIPENLAMTRAEIALTEMDNRDIDRISKLIQLLIENYDLIIFDTPQTIGCLNRSILLFLCYAKHSSGNTGLFFELC